MFKRSRALSRLFINKIKPHLGLIIRVFFCFVAGLVVLATTSNQNFDNRFNIRGPQKLEPTVVLVTISRDDIFNTTDFSAYTSRNLIRSLKELSDFNDMFYWNPSLWSKAFKKLSQNQVKTIVLGIDVNTEMAQTLNLSEKNIFWSQKIKSELSGQSDFYPDPDGTIRHFSLQNSSFIYRITKNYLGKNPVLPNPGESINFLGGRGHFPTYSFTNLVRGDIPNSELKNKIVIIAEHENIAKKFVTPVGLLTKGELLGHILYNVVHKFWITQMPYLLASLYLFFILIFILWIVFKYPESVALAFSGFFTIGLFVLSSALFDLKAFWLPVEAPLATIVFTYVVITGYRLGLSEKHSWKSEKELIYLSEVEALKNNFLSLISHDLKNPLAKIQGITDRLLTSPQNQIADDFKNDLVMIRQTSDELRQYITSILQLTKIEASEIKINKVVCDLNDIVNSVIERLKPLADSKKIKITTQLEPLFSQELDRHLIEEVLINLVENAIKYSDEKSEVNIKTEEVNNEVKVEVSDSAGGIDEAELPKVFDKFFRGKGDKTIKVTGSGLGLYLVKYFIELHDGRVFIDSKKGVGTKIGFYLPLDSVSEQVDLSDNTPLKDEVQL